MTTTQTTEIADQLRKLVPTGSTVFTILRHVSASGMTRWIDLYVIIDNEPRFLSNKVAQLGIGSLGNVHNGVKIGGCGMDMGFKLVYDLSQALYGDGYALNHRWL